MHNETSGTQAGPPPLIEVRGLKKYFPVSSGLFRRSVGTVRAVDDVSFAIERGKVLGLVGESGCGKTTASRAILRAVEPTGGEVIFRPGDGREIRLLQLNKSELREIRCRMQMIFQDPYSSLNPRMTVEQIVGEPLRAYGTGTGADRRDRVAEVLETVGLNVAHMSRYPHAFSGGQRQRIGIARALVLNPDFIIADEAVSALDVSVQAQVLNLLKDLHETRGLTYLFVSHDLAVVRHLSDNVAAMYAGRLVEYADTKALFHAPRHPYVEALLSAVPQPDPDAGLNPVLLQGEVANPARLPSGCPFHPRCRYAQPVCKTEVPELKVLHDEVGRPHHVSCHIAEDLDLKGV